MRTRATLLLALALAGCASATAIPDADRAALENELTGKRRYVRVSLYQAPFWQDEGTTLLSPAPPPELALFNDAHGQPVPGKPATGIVPAGHTVTITKVELPTGIVVAGRQLYTPRYNPWVYLAVDGDKSGQPSVLVLRAGLKSHEEFIAALNRLLAVEDPTPRLTGYSDEVREGIAKKQIVREMDAEAVEMAWGIPDHKTINLKDGNRVEEWSYAGGKRKVTLENGRVSSFDAGASAAPAAAPPGS